MNNSTKKSGWTLVELLVVLGILSILSAIVFPVFARVRERSRTTQCLSNIRQIGIAVQQYSDDWGRYPYWYNERSVAEIVTSGEKFPGKQPGVGWAVRIAPYLKNHQLFQCPSDVTQADETLNGKEQYFEVEYTDYSLNEYASGISESLITSPDKFIIILDGYIHNSSSTLKDNGFGDRHAGSANYCFADGHVKTLKVSQTFSICGILDNADQLPTFCIK